MSFIDDKKFKKSIDDILQSSAKKIPEDHLISHRHHSYLFHRFLSFDTFYYLITFASLFAYIIGIAPFSKPVLNIAVVKILQLFIFGISIISSLLHFVFLGNFSL